MIKTAARRSCRAATHILPVRLSKPNPNYLHSRRIESAGFAEAERTAL